MNEATSDEQPRPLWHFIRNSWRLGIQVAVTSCRYPCCTVTASFQCEPADLIRLTNQRHLTPPRRRSVVKDYKIQTPVICVILHKYWGMSKSQCVGIGDPRLSIAIKTPISLLFTFIGCKLSHLLRRCLPSCVQDVRIKSSRIAPGLGNNLEFCKLLSPFRI